MIQTWGIFEPNQNNSKGSEIWQRGWRHGREFIGKEWTLIEKGKVALAKERTRRKGEGDDAWDKGIGNHFASVFAVNPNEWNIYYSPLILGGYVINRITMWIFLDLNESKIHTIYLVEF